MTAGAQSSRSSSGGGDNPPIPLQPDVLEIFKLTRSQIEHEDTLCNHRMIWLINLHALLFGAYAFSLSAEAGPKGDAVRELILAARYGIFMAGILTPMPVILALFAAKQSIDDLVKGWMDIPEAQRTGFPQIIGNYRPETSSPTFKKPGTWLGQTPIFLLPILLIIVWIGIFLGSLKPIFIVFAGVIAFALVIAWLAAVIKVLIYLKET